MLKKIALFIVAGLCFALGGCGGNDLPATNTQQFDNGVTASKSSLNIPYSPGFYVTSADWYFPPQTDGGVSAKGIIWLLSGDTAFQASLVAQIAGQTHHIVVVPEISAVEIPSQPGRYLGNEAMQQAVADMMLGDRMALASSANAAGFKGALPNKFLLAANLLGVVMFDGVASSNQFAAANAKIDSLGIPLYQIAAPPQAGNHWGSTTEQLVALRRLP